MSKMKIIDEIADAQVSYIKETLYDSIQWGIDGTELDVKGLEGDEYNHLMTMIYNATIEKLKIEIDEK
jgi:hypothetical protein|tara:strand:- start:1101 stop:1304 length:204 start_codon:yes stop_codon:yes gene_type:complete